jgi:clan AA aspartic protease
MMRGFVNANCEAVISVAVGKPKKIKSTNAVIDTGFSGFLSLPIAIISELDLPWSYRDRATLGDGSETVFDIYDATVVWDGQLQDIEINAAETDPLVGMSLLRGYRLQVDTIEGGLVTITALGV